MEDKIDMILNPNFGDEDRILLLNDIVLTKSDFIKFLSIPRKKFSMFKSILIEKNKMLIKQLNKNEIINIIKFSNNLLTIENKLLIIEYSNYKLDGDVNFALKSQN